MLKKKKIQRAH